MSNSNDGLQVNNHVMLSVVVDVASHTLEADAKLVLEERCLENDNNGDDCEKKASLEQGEPYTYVNTVR